MNNPDILRKTKRSATLLLLLAASVFLVTLCLPPVFSVRMCKAIAEAAMVGGLADWFAITALFRKIPLPLIGRHTAIIPRNKQRIADNLGLFVEQKFLSPSALTRLMQRHDPSDKISKWLLIPDNSARVALALQKMISGLLAAGNDKHIRQFIRRAAGKAIDQVDFRQSAVLLLESLTHQNRHQAVLDTVIRQIVKLLGNDKTRQLVARQIGDWFRREYPTVSYIVSPEWLGGKGAVKMASLTDQILLEVARDPDHQLRRGFNRATRHFIQALKTDPKMVHQADKVKQWLKNDANFNHYLGELWHDLRLWISNDLRHPESVSGIQLQKAVFWLGKTLAEDPQLRQSLNQHLEQAIATAGPDCARLLTRHISETIQSWDDQQLVQQIELNIGRDLQYIRINGTLVGGCIGLLLYLLTQLPDWMALLIRGG